MTVGGVERLAPEIFESVPLEEVWYGACLFILCA